jgi:hypothetical protein
MRYKNNIPTHQDYFRVEDYLDKPISKRGELKIANMVIKCHLETW